jgi:NAD(P)-dependent dehydrogenase (short-subunit alcohol dehydrogenase family)
MTQLKNKIAIVTGAGGGFGEGIALAYVNEGARVIVADINGDAAKRVASALGAHASPFTCDVTKADQVQAMVAHCVATFGIPDIVVNNAGNLRDRLFHKMSDEEWSQVIDVHLNGTFFVSRAAANHFREQESGAFVHMTSTSGLIGNLGQANYSAAKLGIAALSKSIALDMQRFNVRSNCIAPFAWSRMTSSIPANTPE